MEHSWRWNRWISD